MLLVGSVLQDAETSVEHTVLESVHPPGVVLADEPLASAPFCTVRADESNSTVQLMTAPPESAPRSAHREPAGKPIAGHAAEVTTVVAAPGTAGGTAGVPALNTILEEPEGRLST